MGLCWWCWGSSPGLSSRWLTTTTSFLGSWRCVRGWLVGWGWHGWGHGAEGYLFRWLESIEEIRLGVCSRGRVTIQEIRLGVCSGGEVIQGLWIVQRLAGVVVARGPIGAATRLPPFSLYEQDSENDDNHHYNQYHHSSHSSSNYGHRTAYGNT